jgi:hypothetical protein
VPKKLYPSEPAVLFELLHASTLEADPEFTIRTTDPTYKSFASELIDQHFPSQSELPLT